MNTSNKAFHRLLIVIGYMTLSMLLVSCSNDDVETVNQDNVAIKKPYDHDHEITTDMEKHQFEHKFAKQCVAREITNSVNKEMDRERFAEPCLCIATYVMEDLTAVEAEKYLYEKKHPQSLRIKYETAAYNCLQTKQPAKSPKIFEHR